MMKGNEVPNVVSSELIETVDILPAMLQVSGLDIPQVINGNLPKVLGGDKKRKFTYSQILHPNQTYKVRIKEESISYYLETKYPVLSDLTINLKGFQSKIINDMSGEEVTEKWIDKKKEYDSFVLDRVKNLLRWSE